MNLADLEVEPLYIPIGRLPVTSLVLVGDKLWLSCGSVVHILSSRSVFSWSHNIRHTWPGSVKRHPQNMSHYCLNFFLLSSCVVLHNPDLCNSLKLCFRFEKVPIQPHLKIQTSFYNHCMSVLICSSQVEYRSV